MTSPDQINIIATKILVETQDASANLKKFDNNVKNASTRVVTMAQEIKRLRDETGKTTKELAAMFQSINAPKGGGQFGKLGLSNEQITKAKVMVDTVEKFDKVQAKAAKSSQNLGSTMQKTGTQGKDAFSKVLSATNTLNITFGILASTLVRNVLQGITEFFQTAIKNATEYEDTLFRLTNVERELSFAGVEVSMSGLKKGILEIKEILPIFSKEDIAGLVGKVAISTKDLRYSEQQILDLSKAIGILNIRSTESETLNQTAGKVITALLSGTTKGVSNLGIQLDDSTLKLQAMKDGFLRAGESVSDLTKEEKGLVKLAVILNSANGELGTMDEYLASNTAKLQENAAAWNDLKTATGQFILPFIPALTTVIDLLTDSVNGLKTAFVLIASIMEGMSTVITYAIDGQNLTVNEGKKILEGLLTKFTNAFFKDTPKGLKPGGNMEKFFDKYLTPSKETKTGFTGAPGVDEEQQAEDQEKAKKHGEKLAEIMQDNSDKLADIERDYQRKKEDIALDYSQKIEDIARDTALKREDADRDYGQKVEDINRSANEKIAEAQASFRQKEIDREQEYQNKLRELREKFLFDLEDALRNRDARQVLRLIREYNLDKKNLEEKRKLQKKDDVQDLQRKIDQIERERVLKLEAAKREYDEKLEEIKRGEARAMAEARRWHSRQLADARTWYLRQLADQREFLKRKLADLQQAYAQELSMASQFQNALLSSQGSSSISGGGGEFTPYSASGGIGSGMYNPYDIRTIYKQLGIPGFADGGTLIARKPTLALFGEKSPEVASFQPINKGGFSASFGNPGGGGGAGGQMSLRISLSEGLVADIVENSLEKMATHIDKTRRSA